MKLFVSLLFLLMNHSITSKAESPMKFELMKLPYASNALEPIMSENTLNFHHGKHLQAYVNNLNNLIVGTKFESADLETIVKESDGVIFNNAGQVLNHNLYFTQFTPNGNGQPSGKFEAEIIASWGSFAAFQKEFEAAGVSLFGSGWVWLAKDKEGKLSISKEPNAGNPLTKGLTPIMGFDVWEHSYYLDYQNRRADHLKDLWKLVNWEIINERYNLK